MSSKLYGAGEIPTKVSVSGTPPVPFMITPGIEAVLNRRTSLPRILDYLKNGFDWNKFLLPLIARFPAGYEPSERFKGRFHEDSEDRLLALLDGDHRRHMHLMTFPTAAQMPALRIDVPGEKVYHKLFGEINYKNRKNCNANEVFLHDVLCGDTKALIFQDHLITCALSVEGSPEQGGTIGTPRSPHVNITNFLKAIKLTSISAVAMAAAALKLAYPSDQKIQGDLLGGTAYCFHLYPELFGLPKIAQEFDAWIRTLGMYQQQRQSRTMKAAGGDIHQKQYESVARGMIKDFRDANAGFCSKKYKQTRISLPRVDSLFK